MSGNYEDIIGLPRHISGKRAPMSATDRAAQFAPFAALTGYEEAIGETARYTCCRMERSDTRRGELDQSLREIMEVLNTVPSVRVVYFVEDLTKDGGAYVTGIHRICKIDLIRRELITQEGDRIPLEDIWEMELLE